ncbi:ras guanine nucleotide exchange factor domain-containing protein [Hygrophoropsis aurantiaca]|uniref:Ras guanine nucleotide exchange factor domain-containing protein n=1 Tax=Hygrophoropsis aurantiaca TaxID=72124 RepID=A0ACB8AQZ6_9AGAM|nr:ras guanine nucleotide exchange factor domain-containing protein [Hygrophoropsis aurantiaca]
MLQTKQTRTPRQSLRVSIDASPFQYQPTQSSPPPSVSSSSLMTNGSTPSTSESDWSICQVICLYDFESQDQDQLSFKQNEILNIVKQEDTGWWAAVRPPGDRIGWIPSAFVEILGDEAPYSALATEEHKKNSILEQDSYRTDDQKILVQASYLDDHPYFGNQADDWVPVFEDFKVPSMQLVTPTDLIGKLNFNAHEDRKGSFESFFNLSDDENSPLNTRSPSSTPMPSYPPPQSPAALVSKEIFPKFPTATPLINAPTAQTRQIRPLPMLVDDRDSLTRLSALLESHSNEQFPSLTTHGVDINKAVDAPISDRDILDVDTDGTVKAGTLGGLVDKLIHEQTSDQDISFQKTFLLTFRTFVSPEDLLNLLMERFERYPSQSMGLYKGNNRGEGLVRSVHDRILAVLASWMENDRLFNEDPHISKTVTKFLSGIHAPAHSVFTARSMLQSNGSLARQQSTNRKRKVGSKKYRRPKSNTVDLLRWDPNDIAEQLCLFEFDYYAAVRPQECLNWRKAHSGKDVANIIAFFDTHEQLSVWVKMSVFSGDTSKKRANIVDFWIRVADKCRKIHNFHSLSAIIGGLADPDLARLPSTWARISRRSLFDTSINACDASALKTSIRSSPGPCLPTLRLFLMDIVQIERDFSDNVENSTNPGDTTTLISFIKRQKLRDAISTVLRHQSQPYEFAECETARGFIQGQLRTASTMPASWFAIKSEEARLAEEIEADNIRKSLDIDL